MVDYIDTRIGFKPHDRDADDYVSRQLRVELERIEWARKRRIKVARNSFVNWLQDVIAQVGRACGYHLSPIPRIKLIRVWVWLFDYKNYK